MIKTETSRKWVAITLVTMLTLVVSAIDLSAQTQREKKAEARREAAAQRRAEGKTVKTESTVTGPNGKQATRTGQTTVSEERLSRAQPTRGRTERRSRLQTPPHVTAIPSTRKAQSLDRTDKP
jgi:hypothetical protein